ncbi:hypothetical protein PoMZ_06120 [Pyricularia oryzae]|uniref:Uncharacterized protein n=1 Tax=Pyricularia oryzae TaxID=318829 RepID=A0A4P7NQE8_PYROR|nr:hypothetical protein PoMZ_06120 [Pyricularia oryzae]
MRVFRNKKRRTATILHDFYIEKIGMRFRFAENKGYPTTPFPEKFIPKFKGEAFPKKIKLYQEIIGLIFYTVIIFRPDVAHAIFLFCRFLTNPNPFHRRLAKRVLQYSYGTRFLGIKHGVIQTIPHLIMANNASFGNNPKIKKSFKGYEYAQESFTIIYLEFEFMPANGFTKPLSLNKFEHFRAFLNLYDAQHEVQGGLQTR